MPTTEPLNFSQPDNELSQIATQQRSKLIPKNDYKDTMPSVEKERTKKIETDRSNSGMYKQFTEKIFSENSNKILSGDGYYAGDNLYAAV